MTRRAPAVPDAVLDAIRAYRRLHPMKMRAIAEGVMELSDMFTGRRPLRPGYLARPRLRAAYIHYYLPLHYLKIRRVIDELIAFAGPIGGRALDYGCGPGSAALSLADGDVDLYDVVDEVLDDADFLIRTAAPRVRPRIVREPDSTYRLIVAANVLSEMRDPVALRRLLEQSLEPDGYLVVVEPAMREPTRRLMRWRDELTAVGFRIAAPCLGIGRCPMLAGEDMWCHQDVAWSRPAFIDEIDRRTGLNKESLKYSYLVVTRTGRTLADGPAHWRVVSDRHAAKGRVWSFLCGREGPLCRAEMLTRHRGAARRDFEHARRGDLLTVDPPLVGESARLGESTVVRRVTE
jgi:ribosomal protein RSM22 (predicted rRNA methylase)